MKRLAATVLIGCLTGWIGCAAENGKESDSSSAPGGQSSQEESTHRSEKSKDRMFGDSSSFEADNLLPPKVAALPERSRAPYVTIRVFYGTDRAPTGSREPSEFFGRDPGPLSFGYCDVSIPAGHKKGELESPKIWKFEFREDPKKHVVLMNVEPVDGPRFISELQRTVWQSIRRRETPEGVEISGGEALVFVHGFNNTFEDAARRTAQIAYDLDFQGATIMYSWPSQGSPTLWAYKNDGKLAGWSQEHLVAFLAGIARESGARRIHLIAHSMGNRVVAETLRRLAEYFVSGKLPKLNQVILTAPDIDAQYFKTEIAPKITQTAERITIYSSSEDLALKASSWVNRLSRHRLGEAGKELTTFPQYQNIEVIDASSVQTDLFAFRHSYHADSPTVLKDIELVLQGLPPRQRGLISLIGPWAWKIHTVGKSLKNSLQPAVIR